jgi:hypothetical protein
VTAISQRSPGACGPGATEGGTKGLAGRHCSGSGPTGSSWKVAISELKVN